MTARLRKSQWVHVAGYAEDYQASYDYMKGRAVGHGLNGRAKSRAGQKTSNSKAGSR